MQNARHFCRAVIELSFSVDSVAPMVIVPVLLMSFNVSNVIFGGELYVEHCKSQTRAFDAMISIGQSDYY